MSTKILKNKLKFFSMLIVTLNSIFIYFAPYFKDDEHNFSHWFYLLYFLVSFLSTSVTFTVYLVLGCFFAQISDKGKSLLK